MKGGCMPRVRPTGVTRGIAFLLACEVSSACDTMRVSGCSAVAVAVAEAKGEDQNPTVPGQGHP